MVGGLWYGSWQVVVESGQAIAGTVSYESHNAFYQYHVKAWTIAHQITALFLLSGLSAKAVCLLVSAVLGALVFTAFSGIVFTLSKHKLLSLAAPFTILSLLVVNVPFRYGVAYPIFMFDTHHSNGIMGRNLGILTLIVLATGHRRAGFLRLGFLLLGLLPAFHITWGAWIWGVVVCWSIWEKSLTREGIKEFAPYMGFGLAITLVSFLYQQFAARGLPVVDIETQSLYLSSFRENWDFHRRAVALDTPGMYMGIATLLLSMAWLRSFRATLLPEASSLLRILIITSVFSIVACCFAAIPHVLPNLINMLLIGRFINISIAVLPVLILGLLGSHVARSRFIQFLLAAHFSYLIFNYFFLAFLASDRFGWFLPHWVEFCVIGALLAAYAMGSKTTPKGGESRTVSRVFAGALCSAMLFVFFMLGHSAMGDFRDRKPLINRKLSSVLERAGESKGYLVSPGGVELLQLITGRPLLINTGALDQVSVVPSSGPEIARVLDRVYGIDFFDPPEEIRRRRPSALLPDSGREVWETRTSEEWGYISAEFEATQLLAPARWSIQLPPLVTDEEWALYDLPQDSR